MTSVYENWPERADLEKIGHSASCRDDCSQAELRVSYVEPHITERSVHIVRDDQYGVDLRFVSPLDGGSRCPHTVLSLYALQSALSLDHTHNIFAPQTIQSPSFASPVSQLVLPVTQDGGGLVLDKLRGNWIRLTVRGEGVNLLPPERQSASVCFNKATSPHIYHALQILGQAIRRDLKGYQ